MSKINKSTIKKFTSIIYNKKDLLNYILYITNLY